jgi:hypothetical protein
MTDVPRRPLTPAQLTEALQRLEDVMDEAARIRREITEQMTEQKQHQQQKVSVTRRPRKRST